MFNQAILLTSPLHYLAVHYLTVLCLFSAVLLSEPCTGQSWAINRCSRSSSSQQFPHASKLLATIFPVSWSDLNPVPREVRVRAQPKQIQQGTPWKILRLLCNARSGRVNVAGCRGGGACLGSIQHRGTQCCCVYFLTAWTRACFYIHKHHSK